MLHPESQLFVLGNTLRPPILLGDISQFADWLLNHRIDRSVDIQRFHLPKCYLSVFIDFIIV